jgi:hypothetical protein
VDSDSEMVIQSPDRISSPHPEGPGASSSSTPAPAG